MKTLTLTAAVLLLNTGYAFAVPEKAEGGPPSGRPGAVLDESNAERFGQRRLGAVTH